MGSKGHGSKVKGSKVRCHGSEVMGQTSQGQRTKVMGLKVMGQSSKVMGKKDQRSWGVKCQQSLEQRSWGQILKNIGHRGQRSGGQRS